MKLIWKLLRQHISVAQLTGFSVANLVGMFIVLFGVQFYFDVIPAFTSEDSFMKADYLIVSKKFGISDSNNNAFSASDIDDFRQQAFVSQVGAFTSSAYKVEATMGVSGTTILNSEIFFESIPDAFIDVPLEQWTFDPQKPVVPIILPKSYLAMYNFGFAQSHSLPKINEGLLSLIDFRLFIHGNGRSEQLQGKVIGFSNRLSSILVPQSFMDWSNARYSSETPETNLPSRLIVQLKSSTDGAFSQYAEAQGYDISDNNMDAERIASFLKLLVSIVIVIGLIISALSFYLLVLSIFLLVQKNSAKLQNLMLIGYSMRQVSRPYLCLTVGLNLLVVLLTWLLLFLVRQYYMEMLQMLFPAMDDGSAAPMLIGGVLLLALVAAINAVVLKRKISAIWYGKA